MRSEPVWRRYTRFWGTNVDADVDDEMQFHLETRIEELVERGLSARAARAQALEEYGDRPTDPRPARSDTASGGNRT